MRHIHRAAFDRLSREGQRIRFSMHGAAQLPVPVPWRVVDPGREPVEADADDPFLVVDDDGTNFRAFVF